MATSSELKPQDRLEPRLEKPRTIPNEELLEATSPLLAAYYEGVRRRNGRKNKFDVIKQNKELEKQFISLCKKNILFYLTVIGRFDLVRTLFKPHPPKHPRLLSWLHVLEQKHEKIYLESISNRSKASKNLYKTSQELSIKFQAQFAQNEQAIEKFLEAKPTHPANTTFTVKASDYAGNITALLAKRNKLELGYRKHQADLGKQAVNDGATDLKAVL